MRSIVIVSLVLLFVLAACGHGRDSETTNALPQGSGLPASNNSTSATATESAQGKTESNSSAALNPAHGQPGHRCEIPVGAPLDSKPTTPTIQNPPVPIPASVTTTGAAPIINPVQTATTTTGSGNASGLNPAHGQPGHRCDIPVGQPLNSKPAPQPTVVTNQTTVPSPISPVLNNPVMNPIQQTTTTAPGMNPPHGQPGHKCEIPVGQPLNSKPVTTTVTPNKDNKQ